MASIQSVWSLAYQPMDILLRELALMPPVFSPYEFRHFISFNSLVNVLNTRIGAAASGNGKCGQLGFTTLSETCEFANEFLGTVYHFDNASCSPYLSVLGEWISYESKTSISCKVNYVKSLKVGGLMLYSLNSDDVRNSCGYLPRVDVSRRKPVFPLAQTAKQILSG